MPDALRRLPSAAVRTTVASVHSQSEAAELLRDLGCAVREDSPLAPPEALAANADAVIVHWTGAWGKAEIRRQIEAGAASLGGDALRDR